MVPLELSRGVLPEQEYLKWSAPSTNGTSTIELSFHGRRIGLYSFDQSAQTLIRLEAPRSISVFDIREFHVDPNYGIEFARSGFTINPMAPPANQIDLHTHFGGTMRAETIINVAGEVGSPMPVEYLDRYHIRYLDHAVETVGTRQVVRLRPENFGQGELDKLMSRMSIPEGNRIIFPGMEAIYDLRNQVTKDVNAFPLYLKHIAQEYKQQGVKYAELSISDILDPAWLAKAKEVLPDIERETGVKLRFVAGIWRLGEPGYIADRVRRVMELKNEPYIVGVDFMGEELNSTRVFANEIKQLAEFRRTQRPDFQIRVHAGENQNELENVKEAIRLGATRIGHGLFGVDEETIRLARKHNVIIELQTNSNLALSNINSKNIVPVKQYLDAGVRVSLGTDGYGMYQTSARSEQAVMLSLGLTHADFFKIKESDRLYLKTMEAAERRLIRRNPARSASEQAQPIAEQ